MLVGYIGVPQLSLLDLRLASEGLGASVAKLDTTTRHVRLHHLHPERRGFLSPIIPVFIESSDLMRRGFRVLNKSKFKLLGMVSMSISELYEFSIEPYRNGNSTFTMTDLRAIIDSGLSVTSTVKEAPTKSSDLSEGIMRGVNKDSVLQKVQSCLYRVRDHQVRATLQAKVYRFLAGDTGLPKTDLPFMNAALQGELLDRFRKAVKKSASIGIDAAAEEFFIDRFEIAFVLAKKSALKSVV